MASTSISSLSSSSSSASSSVASKVASVRAASANSSSNGASRTRVTGKAKDAGGRTLPSDIFSISDEDLADQYSFKDEIGYGNWGSIWRCHSKTTPRRQVVALKLVHRSKESDTSATRVRALWSEFKILRSFKAYPHANVLRVSSFIITPAYAVMTMGFHPGGVEVGMGEGERTHKVLQGLCKGIEWLHSHGVSHNDVKPANIVLSAEEEPVLIDFGFANSYGLDWKENERPGRSFWSCLAWGTPEYLSPQRAKKEWHDERLSDLFAVGVTLYEIVVGRTPFEEDDTESFLTEEALEEYYQRTLEHRIRGEYSITPLFESLVLAIIDPSPHSRLPSVTAALEHPYFSPAQASPVKSPSANKGSPAKKRLAAAATAGPDAPAPAAHRRVAQLVDQHSTPTRPNLHSKSGSVGKEMWNPRETTGKASLGTRSPAAANVTPGGRKGTPTASASTLKVFEDRVGKAVSPATPAVGTPTRSALAERMRNTQLTAPTAVAPAGKGKGKEAKGTKVVLPLAAAKLQEARERRAVEATLGAGTEGTTGKENTGSGSETRAPAGRPQTAVTDVFSAPTTHVGSYASTETGKGFGTPRRLFNDATGSLVKEKVAKEVLANTTTIVGKGKPTKLRKRAPTLAAATPQVQGQEGAPAPTPPVLKPIHGPARQPSLLRLNDTPPGSANGVATHGERPPSSLKRLASITHMLRNTQYRRRYRAASVAASDSAYTIIDRSLLLQDADAPFPKEDRIQAFRAHIEDIVAAARRSVDGELPVPPPFLERQTVDSGKEQANQGGDKGKRKNASGKRWRRASIATSSPTASPERVDDRLNDSVVQAIKRPSELQAYAAEQSEKARKLQVRQSLELRRPGTPRADRVLQTSLKSDAAPVKIRPSAAPSFVDPPGDPAASSALLAPEEVTSDDTVTVGAPSIWAATPECSPSRVLRSNTLPKREIQANNPKLSARKVIRPTTSAGSLVQATATACSAILRARTPSSFSSRAPTPASLNFTDASSTSSPPSSEFGSRATPATSNESMFARFIAATPRVERPHAGTMSTSYTASNTSSVGSQRSSQILSRSRCHTPGSSPSGNAFATAHAVDSPSTIGPARKEQKSKDSTVTRRGLQKLKKFLSPKRA